jgi:nicotinate dehydrogenase subunit B
MTLTRREFLISSGALIVSFSLFGTAAAQTEGASAKDSKQVDSWLAVGQDGNVTIFSGKVELGTGTRTALAQIAAEELYVPFERISMVQGDTARTPDEGYTAGSKTIQVANAAAC